MTYVTLDDNDLNDIDYEHLDDLPLEDHIEWTNYQREQIDESDYGAEDWLTA
jgi:hypothetical protein